MDPEPTDSAAQSNILSPPGYFRGWRNAARRLGNRGFETRGTRGFGIRVFDVSLWQILSWPSFSSVRRIRVKIGGFGGWPRKTAC
jgi:hypothetical protein